jgi:nicotinamidase-related amidase
MMKIGLLRMLTLTAAAAGFFGLSHSVLGQGVVGEWNNVQAPPAPELKELKVDSQKTALLVMDFNAAICTAGGARVRERCVPAIPKVKKLLDEARAQHMLVIFTATPNMTPVTDLAAMSGEAQIVGHANKFDGTNLDSLLKDHGITSVILTGTAANGAVLFTAFGAADRGYKVIVPVDTMPGDSAYAEQSSIWGLQHDPGLGNMSTLTTADLIKF